MNVCVWGGKSQWPWACAPVRLDQMGIGPSGNWTKWVLDQLSIGPNGYWTNCQLDQVDIAPNGYLLDQMYILEQMTLDHMMK